MLVISSNRSSFIDLKILNGLITITSNKVRVLVISKKIKLKKFQIKRSLILPERGSEMLKSSNLIELLRDPYKIIISFYYFEKICVILTLN